MTHDLRQIDPNTSWVPLKGEEVGNQLLVRIEQELDEEFTLADIEDALGDLTKDDGSDPLIALDEAVQDLIANNLIESDDDETYRISHEGFDVLRAEESRAAETIDRVQAPEEIEWLDE